MSYVAHTTGTPNGTEVIEPAMTGLNTPSQWPNERSVGHSFSDNTEYRKILFYRCIDMDIKNKIPEWAQIASSEREDTGRFVGEFGHCQTTSYIYIHTFK